ncbi:ankyrin repeat domain-containing protein [Arenicella xantha]|uniref:Ankyrin repeat protein n=1 Tax=Arenicella xantha TaxID=644221 RepID=A0A395JK13_9GAMM|nr:ankyrin repeat domain-containing protein [Arenicella xantha]RBP51123.1 ankyrin repeat protein [Arenicella xantha]
MDFLSKLVAIIVKIVKFIFSAIWLVIGLLIIAAYAYSWWSEHQYEQELAEQEAFIEAEAESYKAQDLGDLEALSSEYQAICESEITQLASVSNGDESALCVKAAKILVDTSQQTGMSLDNFADMQSKVCLRDYQDSDEEANDPENQEYCLEVGNNGKTDAVKNAIALALCEFDSGHVMQHETDQSYFAWLLSKHGAAVYVDRSFYLDCDLKKFSQLNYRGFFTQELSDEELYPDFQTNIWDLLDNKDYNGALKTLRAHPFGENLLFDKWLLDAVLSNHADAQLLTEVLALNGNRVNYNEEYYDQPLSLAINEGLSDAALTLLKAGADPSRPDDSGQAPITLAARANLLPVVTALLAAGVDANGTQNAVSLDFAEPLTAAALSGNAVVFSTLRDNGALLRPENASKFPQWEQDYLADAALQGGNYQIVKAVADAQFSFAEPRRAWTYAIQGGNPQVLAFLFDSGMTLPEHKYHTDIYNALSKSVRTKEDNEFKGGPAEADQMLSLLLKHGLDLSSLSSNGNSLAHHAIVFAAPNNVARTKTENQQDRQLRLKFAARVIDAVLKTSIDVNHVGNKGETLLMKAASRSHPELVKLLINRGAEKSLKNEQGLTALDLAIREGRRLTRFWKNDTVLKEKYQAVIEALGGDPADLDKVAEKRA